MADFDRERWEDQQRQQEVVRNYRRICMIVAPQLEEPLRTPTPAEFYSNIQIDDDSDDEQWSEDIHPRERITHLSYESTLTVINALVEARCLELSDHFRMLRELDQELFDLVNAPPEEILSPNEDLEMLQAVFPDARQSPLRMEDLIAGHIRLN
ncbi:hypothetical protein CKM354_000529000 [Cercospora kikuchii]|uniref:Uncharacterized protein n=1 Tax=Cercospora kikuchii TaxID=84275 RepID=A0A9P3CD16_9PEZI|nr:uncharacterized protein CKM354_000529000 [Cercospora kikuchii]GIZ42009.1 hypothetical protein CKM354_000529000 [Cercospora kikuchii]